MEGAETPGKKRVSIPASLGEHIMLSIFRSHSPAHPVTLSDQEQVERVAEENHPEHTQSKKRANLQHAQESLASPRQSMRDLERQKQPQEQGDEQHTQEKGETEKEAARGGCE